ncbi:MAG: hydrolase TatD [Deltaproteobacteria bacterium CG11_big_fil_rev_8_21_14_0_20_42_23]|nr:MAG: hydrolase TatD [Deltaproteobacteria bacterium CG11_big_fil_rev_8_21_14_0_20_42_23]PJC63530.1 MAG: hydrolase TatD [Deltaproteobacteria bacterium CG_4_9_14_0_2_um_filter_42_21]
MIDTHAHLSFEAFDEDREAVLDRAWKAGLEAIVLIGAGDDFAGNEKALKLANTDERLFAAVGIHPCDAEKWDESWNEKIRNMLRQEKVVALGETGLDFHWEVNRKTQMRLFLLHLEWSHEFELPFIIHSRSANNEVWEVLMQEGLPKRKGVFHCYSGDLDLAKKIYEQGLALGVGGVISFKNAQELHEIVKQLPLDAFVLETDAPYLAPVPYRGKRNESSYVPYIVEKIAELKNISKEEVVHTTSERAKALFHLGGKNEETLES